MTAQDSHITELTESDITDLRYAKSLLENPSLTAQISDVVGTPIEKVLQYVPEKLNNKIGEVTHQALLKGLEIAIGTLGDVQQRRSRDRIHKLVATGAGATGGFFGFTALAVELPVSTGIILRSIADIARSEGHELTDLEVRFRAWRFSLWAVRLQVMTPLRVDIGSSEELWRSHSNKPQRISPNKDLQKKAPQYW